MAACASDQTITSDACAIIRTVTVSPARAAPESPLSATGGAFGFLHTAPEPQYPQLARADISTKNTYSRFVTARRQRNRSVVPPRRSGWETIGIRDSIGPRRIQGRDVGQRCERRHYRSAGGGK